MTLSILACFTGAAFMYGLLSLAGGAPDSDFSGTAAIIVILGLVCMAAGWIRIFMRRPNPRNQDG
jgi:FtsH-binding integral membrane protein